MTAVPSPDGVLCVGRLYCDLVFTGLPAMPHLGRETYAEGVSLHAGGGAVITAAHLAQLGRPAYLAAYWPAPPFAECLRADVEAVGIAAALCRPSESDEPQITVAMNGDGDRAFLTRRVGAAVPRLHRGDLAGIGHLHIGELATLIECPWLLDLARGAGLSISLDCSWDDRTTADVGALISAVDVFMPNEEEVAQLSHLGLTGLLAPLTVIKRGAAGASAVTENASVDMPTVPVPVIDTTGAGDAFNSGFLDAWLSDLPLDRCLAAGNARGAVAVQQSGGFTCAPPEPQRAAASR